MTPAGRDQGRQLGSRMHPGSHQNQGRQTVWTPVAHREPPEPLRRL